MSEKWENWKVNQIDRLTKQMAPEYQQMTQNHARQYAEYLSRNQSKK